MRSAIQILLASFVATLFLTSVVHAAPSEGDLTFAELPVIDATVSGVGGGELPLVGDGVLMEGSAAGITITRVWTEESVVSNPVGGDVRVQPPQTGTEDISFDAARFQLVDHGETFRSLLYTDGGGRIETAPAQVQDVALAAYRAPELILDDYWAVDQNREGEAGTFTYQAEGDRFPSPATEAQVTGAFTTFLWDATLEIVEEDGTTHSFVSGSTEDTSDGTTTLRHEHHLVRVTEGTASAAGAGLVAWLQDPTFTLAGTVSSGKVTGGIDVEGDDHSLDAVPVTLIGDFTIRPFPTGEPTPVREDDGMTDLGTSQPSQGRYQHSRALIEGDVTVLAIGTQEILATDSDVAVATAAGVLGLAGLAIVFSSNVKWAMAGLFAPLYAKTQRDRLLDNESRERIFQAIRANPGINLSQIHRMSDLGWGVTVYHLKMMEKNDLIVSETSARDRCFFENDARFLELRKAIATIANREPVQRIVASVVEHPGLNQGDVIAATGLTQRTVSYYLGRLAKGGLVSTKRVKNFVHYEPTERLTRAYEVLAATAPVEAVAATEQAAVPA